ncbi:MAG: hypothetical protein AMJ75_02900 [Phycisphaerae bacterium SM1_79]|nr:MAG: hypothetical protein AMJ75_02900 [Phycisphaerae bacterium SM1_79]
MNQEANTNRGGCRSWWRNCDVEADSEILAIDQMEDSIGPLDTHTTQIRQLIARFESCYHQADKEAERIAKAIGAGRRPTESSARPPKRRKELQNSRRILSRWCKNTTIRDLNLDVGGIRADQLLSFIGEPSPLKVWQVERVVDKVIEALDPNRPSHRMVLDLGDYGEPGAYPTGEYYRDDASFLEQTKNTLIHDTVDGRKARISLGLSIDLLMPCHWDFVGSLVTILKAIGGDLHPPRPFACCSRNLGLSPLCDRVRTISNTLRSFWRGSKRIKDIDRDVLASLGPATTVKRWLAASLDKTIRLQLEASSDFWLTFS